MKGKVQALKFKPLKNSTLFLLLVTCTPTLAGLQVCITLSVRSSRRGLLEGGAKWDEINYIFLTSTLKPSYFGKVGC
jgi:hypothetical protein